MFKKEPNNFKKTIIPATNQKYLSKKKVLYERFGKTIERNPKNPLISVAGVSIHDYFALFDSGKPDISFSAVLLNLGEWQDYGSKLYRIHTTYNLEEVSNMLCSELAITKKDFLLTSPFTGFYFPHG